MTEPEKLPSAPPLEKVREVRYEVSKNFVDLLRQLKITLLVSTYQAGKLVVLGSKRSGLALSFHNFEQAMGVAVHPQQIAVGGKTQVWYLRNARDVAHQMNPALEYDDCYLARSSHITEEIHVHEMEWCGDELWLVNTRFSCLCTLREPFSFVPRWRPPFISRLAAEDRCHLNGLACENGVPRYATAMAETDQAGGWRPTKASSGCLLDVTSGQTVARGFAMPHSPRVYQQRVWLLDSGRGRLVTVDPSSGRADTISQQPGYTRGLCFAGPFAFVGLSRIRETSTFGGVPIAAQRDDLKCAVVAIDLRSGQRVAWFEFLAGVEEIFDVRVLPGVRNPVLTGPFALSEGVPTIWYAPPLDSLRQDSPPPEDRRDRGEALPAAPAAEEAPAGPSSLRAPEEALQLFQEGNALSEEDRFDEALACFQRALNLAPQLPEAHCNLGLAQQFLGRIGESIECLQQSIALAPHMPAGHMNLSMSWFLAEEFHRAWPEYEWRWKCARFGDRPTAAIQFAPVWDGSSLAGRRLLVYGEQGIGDEIMFASCYAELVQQAASCIFACAPRLVPLFARSFPAARVIATESLQQAERLPELGRLDLQIAAGSVPKFLRPSKAHFPRQEKFLLADADRVARWRKRLDELGPGRKVGISWKGGKEAVERRRRSIPLPLWSEVLRVPDVTFVSVQYGDSADELRQLQAEQGTVVHRLEGLDPLQDMDDFAALTAALDAVVSIDNSTIHLSGALGVPTIALLSFPSASHWRWFMTGDETVWYPSLRLVRRRHPEPWEPSLARAAQLLREINAKTLR